MNFLYLHIVYIKIKIWIIKRVKSQCLASLVFPSMAGKGNSLICQGFFSTRKIIVCRIFHTGSFPYRLASDWEACIQPYAAECSNANSWSAANALIAETKTACAKQTRNIRYTSTFCLIFVITNCTVRISFQKQ